MRIGFGYDAHRFETGRKLVLGGVTIPYDKGLAAHSDGDALIHALCDALLGAAGLGDIGQHFPDTQAKYAGIDSRILLRHVMELLKKKNLSISNVDITVVAQTPRLTTHMPAMKRLLADDMGIKEDQLNIKATTTEGMGFTGRGEGIATYAVALLNE
ncbi:MAG TPA: 2-C-methyl-D-erythritol 2,4-cyclodiphosphate synthase [Gammaproteobacteria bacterium]